MGSWGWGGYNSAGGDWPPGKAAGKMRGKPSANDGKKRAAAAEADDDGPSTSGAGASIGQQTSFIRNKQKRSELYHQLKHKAEVSWGGLAGTSQGDLEVSWGTEAPPEPSTQPSPSCAGS